MFTGLVEAKHRIVAKTQMEGGVRMRIAHDFEEPLQLGESVAISGTCLTVVAFDGSTFDVELSNETLDMTILGGLDAGDFVNMERALRASDRLGGHMVTGHVDGVGTITHRREEGEMTRLVVEVPRHLSRYVAHKGSLTVDGVSLTINGVEENLVDFCIIPHTLEVTTLGEVTVKSRVNVEVDLVARYVARLLEEREN